MRGLLWFVALGLAVIAALGARCEAPELLQPDRNRPPDTFLSRGPEQEEVAYFQVHLYWTGYDPDGTVSQWQFAIDDTVVRPDAEIVGTGWIRTTKSDSVFIFQASLNGTDQQRDHTFFLASIDNEGKADNTPAVLDFAARTVAYPIPEVVSGPAEGETLTVFSSVTLCWGGTDPDGRIVSMSYRLDPIDLGFTTVPIGAQECATYNNLPSNGSRESYRFLLQAEDDAGSRNLQPVERRFVVNHDPNTEITRLISQSEWGNVLGVMPRDTIPDESQLSFDWIATDVDGEIKGAFWAVDGLNIRSDDGLQDSSETRSATTDEFVTSDRGGENGEPGARLIVGSIDEYGRAEGSPDTIAFYVNFPPSVVITDPATFVVSAPNGRLLLAWRGVDRDGRSDKIAFDIEWTPPTGCGNVETRTIEANAPDEIVVNVCPGIWTFSVTPTDRDGEGKTGVKVEKTVRVTSGVSGGTAP